MSIGTMDAWQKRVLGSVLPARPCKQCDQQFIPVRTSQIYCSRPCNYFAQSLKKALNESIPVERRIDERNQDKRRRGLGKALSESPQRTPVDRIAIPFIREEYKFLYENAGSGG